MLVAVGLNRDQEEDEERSGTDEQSGSDGLQTGNGIGTQNSERKQPAPRRMNLMADYLLITNHFGVHN